MHFNLVLDKCFIYIYNHIDDLFYEWEQLSYMHRSDAKSCQVPALRRCAHSPEMLAGAGKHLQFVLFSSAMPQNPCSTNILAMYEPLLPPHQLRHNVLEVISSSMTANHTSCLLTLPFLLFQPLSLLFLLRIYSDRAGFICLNLWIWVLFQDTIKRAQG